MKALPEIQSLPSVYFLITVIERAQVEKASIEEEQQVFKILP